LKYFLSKFDPLTTTQTEPLFISTFPAKRADIPAPPQLHNQVKFFQTVTDSLDQLLPGKEYHLPDSIGSHLE